MTQSDWRKFPALQQPSYPAPQELEAALSTLRALPPLVTSWEIEALKFQLAEAAKGKRLLLQGGDCAESFDACNGCPFSTASGANHSRTADPRPRAKKRGGDGGDGNGVLTGAPGALASPGAGTGRLREMLANTQGAGAQMAAAVRGVRSRLGTPRQATPEPGTTTPLRM